MTNVNSLRFWHFWSKTSDCYHLSFFIELIDHFYSRHSIQTKCWDAWEAAKKKTLIFLIIICMRYLGYILGLITGPDQTSPTLGTSYLAFPSFRSMMVFHMHQLLLYTSNLKTAWKICSKYGTSRSADSFSQQLYIDKILDQFSLHSAGRTGPVFCQYMTAVRMWLLIPHSVCRPLPVPWTGAA